MGGEGTQVPTYQDPNLVGYGIEENLGSTGQGFMNDLLARQNQGLPDEIKNLIRKGIEDTQNASIVSAKRQMKEATAGKQLPTGAIMSGLADLYSQKATAVNQGNTDIAFKDYDAKTKNQANALQGFMGLQGLASGIAGNKNQLAFNLSNAKNQYGMNKYQIDKENEFSFGKLFGDLFNVGGSVLGGMATGGTGFFKRKG